MDINDLRLRLKRVLKALDAAEDEDYKNYFKIEKNGESITTTFPFVGDEIELMNQAMGIILLLGTVKDHLKKAIAKAGHDKNIVEKCIDGSPHLKILMDLYNAEKHGYPVKKSRSGLNPKIANISVGARNNNNGQPIVVMAAQEGGFTVADGYPAPSVVLVAQIIDEFDRNLMDYEDLTDTCYHLWEEIAKLYNLLN